jgi:hypothetical protein
MSLAAALATEAVDAARIFFQDFSDGEAYSEPQFK